MLLLYGMSRLMRRYEPMYSKKELKNLHETRAYVMGPLLDQKVSMYKAYLDQCSSGFD